MLSTIEVLSNHAIASPRTAPLKRSNKSLFELVVVVVKFRFPMEHQLVPPTVTSYALSLVNVDCWFRGDLPNKKDICTRNKSYGIRRNCSVTR